MTDDITKHKDWQTWVDALARCEAQTNGIKYDLATDDLRAVLLRMATKRLSCVAPLIFVAGQASMRAQNNDVGLELFAQNEELMSAHARIAELEAAREGFKQIIDGIEDDQRAPICERDHGYMEAIADVRTALEAIGSP